MKVKHALPLLLKYFAVVGLSCFLAYAISHTIASAEVPAAAAATTASTSDDPSYALPGSIRFETSLSTWKDASRSREVPVKLYYPMAAAKKFAAIFPVILFSHGLGGNREGGLRWAEHWASHGFVVVAMQHAGSDDSLWKNSAPSGIEKNMKAGMTYDNLRLRIDDVHFAIDEVVRSSGAGEAAFANADTQRIGMSGHSFGAQTTLAVSGQDAGALGGQFGLDKRISASIAFSPNARNKSDLARQYGSIKMPFFSITGSRDGSILEDGTKPEDRRLPYENMPAGRKYLAVFEGGDHMVFGGHALSARRPETARDRQIQEGVMVATLAFWNATLKQDAVAQKWLEQGGFKAAIGASDIFEHK